jgi:D-lactate dehydrogenase (cytochrome)
MNLQSKPHAERKLSPDLLARFAAIVGEKYAVTDAAAQQPYLVEMRDLYHGHTPMVLRPGSVAEVAAILALANETKTAIVPQGGNTGLVGGQIPFHGEIVLSLTRLDKIREVDPVSNTMTVEAGVTLQRAREAAAAADRLYPQLLPSEGTCTIGGNLSTNAGGTAAVAHGIARAHALGLEVVLADGRVLHDLNKLKKNNTGYDLKNLFIGAEGTLGIITAAVLRLVPRPRSVETAFAGVPSPQAAVDLLGIASERTGGGVTSCELMARSGIEAVIGHDAKSRDPLAAPYPSNCRRRRATACAACWRRFLPKATAKAWCSTPPSPTTWSRPRPSGASAKCSARCSGTSAPRSSTTCRFRSPRCRPSSPKPMPRWSSLFRAAGRCRSAMSATATSITT